MGKGTFLIALFGIVVCFGIWVSGWFFHTG